MKTTALAWVFALLGAAPAAAQAPVASHPPAGSHQAVVDRYCAGCHNDRRKTGGFSFTSIDLADPAANAAQAEKVIRRVRAGLMPPAGAPRPDKATLAGLATAMEDAIDRSASARPFAGAPELHRLNRTRVPQLDSRLAGARRRRCRRCCRPTSWAAASTTWPTRSRSRRRSCRATCAPPARSAARRWATATWRPRWRCTRCPRS